MGSGLSVSLNVRTECPQAGNTLEGEVTVHVKRSLRDQNTVRLLIYGKEKVHIQARGLLAHSAERNIYCRQIPLGSAKGAGTRIYPFSIQLPHCLPQATRRPHVGSSRGCRIQYKIRAEVGTIGSSINQYVPITSAPLPPEQLPCTLQPMTYEIKAMRYFQSGSVNVAARVPNTRVGRNETIELRLACRNFSISNIQRVQVELVERLSWTTGAMHAEARRHRETLVCLENVSLPPSMIVRCPSMRNLTRGEHAETVNQELFEALANGVAAIQVIVPPRARDSYSGRLIEVCHFLDIVFVTSKLTSNPKLSIPIRIGTPSDAVAQQVNPSPPPSTAPAPSAPVDPDLAAAAMFGRAIYSDESIPIADDVIQIYDEEDAAAALEEENVIVLGGDAVLNCTLEESFVRSPPVRPDIGSLEQLLHDMRAAVDSYTMFEALLNGNDKPAQRYFLVNLKAEDFGRLIGAASPFDQPRVAVLMARQLREGRLTCAHVAAAARYAQSWSKANVVERLMALNVVVDLDNNRHLIVAELSEWERTVVANGASGLVRQQ